ncbi:hypothetical protein KFL_000330090 [Klebsormidium nitens]|uniref:Uncharacterized protein n=1 Tax=Klebsormidium nitens TaxID=105231 RepID=A0A1Y1HNF8_KLENI|nr:hypothetical protein KFL_000330090 [Klebsormidium nitens]|eukprot:GAQ79563.1 hypothetical protein KFL_000330090 [Klebsormidium nitens]
MASPGYGIPNYGTVSDADVNQLLEQFEDENMLSLYLGSHRAGEGQSGAFADVGELTPSYLQDEDGGLDNDLAARLAALKAPRNGNSQGDGKNSAANAGRPPTTTSNKEEVRKNSPPEGKLSPELSRPGAGGEFGSKSGPKDGVRNDGQTGLPVVQAADKHVEPDPDDVTSLGNDLASRLRKLKGGANQRGLPDVDVSKGNAAEAERYASLKKRTTNGTATDVAAANEECSEKQAAQQVAGPSGAPFIDLSRGGAKKQAVEVAGRGKVRESWSNPLAGLFGRQSSSAKSGRAPAPPAGPTDGPRDLDNTERRAREVLAGFSNGGEGANRSSRKNGRPGSASSSIDPSSALFRDLQSVRVPQAEGAYDQVIKEEQKELSEVEALLAAMRDDVRIRRERQVPGLEVAAGEHSHREEEDGSLDSDSELSEEHKKDDKKVEEIAAWAVDAASLEVMALLGPGMSLSTSSWGIVISSNTGLKMDFCPVQESGKTGRKKDFCRAQESRQTGQ